MFKNFFWKIKNLAFMNNFW